LDGFRESVIPKSAFPVDTDDERGKENKVQALYRKYRAREAEQLSGVDLLKRLGMSTIEHTFPSTSDLAASSLFTRMNDKREEELINAIKNAILSTHIWNASDISEDRSLVFESRLVEYFPSKEGREEARKILSDILQQYLGDIRPNPYYALLIADGDNMGKLIDSKRSPEEHRKLSDLISSFAIDAPMIIEKHAGACIYAGGEDILAYLPLQNALACVYELHERFDTLMVGQSFVDVDGSLIT